MTLPNPHVIEDINFRLGFTRKPRCRKKWNNIMKCEVFSIRHQSDAIIISSGKREKSIPQKPRDLCRKKKLSNYDNSHDFLTFLFVSLFNLSLFILKLSSTASAQIFYYQRFVI